MIYLTLVFSNSIVKGYILERLRMNLLKRDKYHDVFIIVDKIFNGINNKKSRRWFLQSQ